MIADEFQNHQPSGAGTVAVNGQALPAGAVMQSIQFAEKNGDSVDSLYVFQQPLPFVVNGHTIVTGAEVTSAKYYLVKISGDYHETPFPIETVSRWIEQQGLSTKEHPLQILTFQGTQLVWTECCLVIMSAAETLEQVTRAALENVYYLKELGRIEGELLTLWPESESDLPLAFEFRERERTKQAGLKTRFEAVQKLQSRVVRMSALVNRPYVYPPTLASQLGERVRERMQMVHRHECLADQLEILAGIYEQCSQRANDYVHTRSGNQLEWIIIILLVAQIILSGFEMLTSIETTAVPATTIDATATEATNNALSVD